MLCLKKGIYQIYIGDSLADTRNNNNLIFNYTQKKLTNRLVPQDPDVFGANKKPNFENFLPKNIQNDNSELNKKDKKKIFDKKLLISQDFNYDNNDNLDIYSEIPTNIFNEINYKAVLQKNIVWSNQQIQ